MDDALATSEQELGFAVAQFGEGAGAPFQQALAQARTQVAEAFQLRQQLDDVEPETPQQRRAMTERIIELCTAASAQLDAQSDAFDELRDAEKNAPAVLAAAPAEVDRHTARLAGARQTLAELASRYPAAAVAPIRGNPDEAEQLLAGIGSRVAEGQSDAAAGRSAEAGAAAREVQTGLGQVDRLLGAVEHARDGLDEATRRLDAALADTRQDLAAAKALPGGSDSAQLAPAIAAAEAAVGEASSTQTDPVARLARIEAANAELERAFGAQISVGRARTALDASLATARSQIGSAQDYITTHRGGVGTEARTRLAEATRLLDHAVSVAVSDPASALAASQQSNALAASAIQTADSNVGAWNTTRTTSGGGALGGIDGSAIVGGLLGALLGGQLGGGSSRGGFGGFSSGGFSSGGFGGGFSSGGGGSRRGSSGSRRSSGGSRRSSGGSSRRSSRGRF